jgi:hypothetical protein
MYPVQYVENRLRVTPVEKRRDTVRRSANRLGDDQEQNMKTEPALNVERTSRLPPARQSMDTINFVQTNAGSHITGVKMLQPIRGDGYDQMVIVRFNLRAGQNLNMMLSGIPQRVSGLHDKSTFITRMVIN